MFKKIFFIILILVMSAASAAVKTPLNLEGVYHCHGNDPTVTPSFFSTILTMTKQGNVYLMQEIDRGTEATKTKPESYNEFGVLDGKTLAVSFQYTDDTKVFGTTVFHVSHEGNMLNGYFYYWNSFQQKGTEICEKEAS